MYKPPEDDVKGNFFLLYVLFIFHFLKLILVYYPQAHLVLFFILFSQTNPFQKRFKKYYPVIPRYPHLGGFISVFAIPFYTM